LIRQALRDDIGRGDITTKTVIPPKRHIRARVYAKAPGILAGTQVAIWVFETADQRIHCSIKRRDGHAVRHKQVILVLQGPAHRILAAERTALNILAHLSGIATLTRRFVQRVRSSSVRIMDTRKTLPGLGLLEKYAVRVGGGYNHRMALDDGVLIKTNHLRTLTQDVSRKTQAIQAAIRQARRRLPGKVIEVEVTGLREFRAALQARPHVIMLDNCSLRTIRNAVRMRNRTAQTSRQPLLEVSGGVTLDNVQAIAKTGVDRISIGQLTHSAPALDVSLEVL